MKKVGSLLVVKSNFVLLEAGLKMVTCAVALAENVMRHIGIHCGRI